MNSSLSGNTFIFDGKATWLNCSCILGMAYASIASMNVSYITNLSCINSGLIQN